MRPKQNRRGDKKAGVTVIRRADDSGGHAPHGGAWKVAYADFVTAMMAFFLLMWLLNATTEDQRKGLADYFSPTNLLSHNSSGTGQPFGGHTAFDQGALVSDRGAVQITFGRRPVLDNLEDDETEIPGRTGQEQHGAVAASASTSPAAPPAAVVVPVVLSAEPTASATVSRAPAAAPATSPAGRGASPEPSAASPASPAASAPPGRPEAPSAASQAADRAEQEKREFAAAAQQIKDAVKNDPTLAGLADHLAVDVTPEGLRIQLLDTRNQAMFAFGSAVPNEAASLLLAKITPVLMRLPEMVSIGGHTDAAPYPGPNMTNWELSTNRANAARRLLVAAGLPEQRLRDVTGHADHDLLLPADPLAPANRRIAIVVLRGTGEPAQGAPEARASGP